MGVLQQASSISATNDSNYEMVEYVISLREGIMDAYDGIIIALKSGDKSKFLCNVVDFKVFKDCSNILFSISSRALCSTYIWILVSSKCRSE